MILFFSQTSINWILTRWSSFLLKLAILVDDGSHFETWVVVEGSLIPFSALASNFLSSQVTQVWTACLLLPTLLTEFYASFPPKCVDQKELSFLRCFNWHKCNQSQVFRIAVSGTWVYPKCHCHCLFWSSRVSPWFDHLWQILPNDVCIFIRETGGIFLSRS